MQNIKFACFDPPIRFPYSSYPVPDRAVEQDDFLAALRREKHRRSPVFLREQAESIAAHARAGRRGKQRGKQEEKEGWIAASPLESVRGNREGEGEEATGSTLNPSRITIQCSQYHASSRRSSASNLESRSSHVLSRDLLSDFVERLLASTVKKKRKLANEEF